MPSYISLAITAHYLVLIVIFQLICTHQPLGKDCGQGGLSDAIQYICMILLIYLKF